MSTDSQNPFEEEFDKNDVVKSFSSKESDEPFITQDDLSDLINMGGESKKAVDLYNLLDDDESGSNVIKEEDTKNHKIISASDLEAILNRDEEERKKDNYNDEYNLDNTNLKDDHSEYIREHFKDFIIAPKIAGTKRTFKHTNLLPGDYIANRGNKVELIDDPLPDKDHLKTTIEINRSDDGEIESIVVLCKCGEKTFIQFDYIDDDDEVEMTTVIKDNVQIQPLYQLKEGETPRNFLHIPLSDSDDENYDYEHEDNNIDENDEDTEEEHSEDENYH